MSAAATLPSTLRDDGGPTIITATLTCTLVALAVLSMRVYSRAKIVCLFGWDVRVSPTSKPLYCSIQVELSRLPSIERRESPIADRNNMLGRNHVLCDAHIPRWPRNHHRRSQVWRRASCERRRARYIHPGPGDEYLDNATIHVRDCHGENIRGLCAVEIRLAHEMEVCDRIDHGCDGALGLPERCRKFIRPNDLDRWLTSRPSCFNAIPQPDIGI